MSNELKNIKELVVKNDRPTESETKTNDLTNRLNAEIESAKTNGDLIESEDDTEDLFNAIKHKNDVDMIIIGGFTFHFRELFAKYNLTQQITLLVESTKAITDNKLRIEKMLSKASKIYVRAFAEFGLTRRLNQYKCLASIKSITF